MEYGEREKKKVQPLSFSYDQQTKTLEEIFSFEETNKEKKRKETKFENNSLFFLPLFFLLTETTIDYLKDILKLKFCTF